MSENLQGQFTKTNLIKTLKGAAIAGAGAIALFLLNWIGTLQISDPIVTSLIAWAVPTLTNAVKEFLSNR